MKTSLQILALVCLLALARPAQAEIFYLMQIDGIPGESMVEGYVGEIDIAGFTSSIFQHGLTYSPGPSSPALSKMKPISITKKIDKSSGQFFLTCATGKHIPKVRLRVVHVNDQGQGPNGEFYSIILTDAKVASVNVSGGVDRTGSELYETIGLSFSKIELRYRPVNADGTLGNQIIVGYDLKTNVKL
jgi:type VI secretion system secreted protein Hcp